MKIGIDIDGCMNNQHNFIINYATKYICENKLPYNIANYENENTEEFFYGMKKLHMIFGKNTDKT